MEWKRQLRRALRAAGHKPSQMTRTSLRPKGEKLHTLRNSYDGACILCGLHVHVQTFPGVRAELSVTNHPVTGRTETSHVIAADTVIPQCRKQAKHENA